MLFSLVCTMWIAFRSDDGVNSKALFPFAVLKTIVWVVLFL